MRLRLFGPAMVVLALMAALLAPVAAGAASTAGPAWTAVIDVGGDEDELPPLRGYSRWARIGELSVDRFSVDGGSHRVYALVQHAGGLYMAVTPALGADFVLDVGGERLVGSDSLVPSMLGRGRYWWPMSGQEWSVGDSVDVSITMEGAGSLDGRALAPPAARFAQVPAEHDGSSEFDLRLVFDEADLALSAELLRDEALAVVGGSVTAVRDVSSGSRRVWEMSVLPEVFGDITISLPAASDCVSAGSVCSADGRMLRNTAQATVAGLSGDASLSSLDVGGLTLSPRFDPQVSLYTADAPAATAQVTVEAVASHSDAVVEISPADADVFAAGHQVDLAEGGQTAVSVGVVAADGTQETVWVMVTRAADAGTGTGSGEAPQLNALQLDGLGEVGFAPEQTRYELDAVPDLAQATVIAGVGEVGATLEVITVHGDDPTLSLDSADADGTAGGHQVSLAAAGDTLVLVLVTSADGLRQRIYVLLVRGDAGGSSRGPGSGVQARRAAFPSLLKSAEARDAVARADLPVLSSLSLDGVTLTPSFAAATTSYTASVGEGVSQVTVAATGASGASVIIVPGDADSGTAGHQVALAAGIPGGEATQTAIAVVVASSGGQLNSYIITVSRDAPSATDATLASLRLDGVDIDPVFHADTASYAAAAPYAVSQVTVHAVASVHPSATVLIAPADADANTAGHQVNLAAPQSGAESAATDIVIVVTDADGITRKTYLVAVTRAAAEDLDELLPNRCVLDEFEADAGTGDSYSHDSQFGRGCLSLLEYKHRGSDPPGSRERGWARFYRLDIAQDDTLATVSMTGIGSSFPIGTSHHYVVRDNQGTELSHVFYHVDWPNGDPCVNFEMPCSPTSRLEMELDAGEYLVEFVQHYHRRVHDPVEFAAHLQIERSAVDVPADITSAATVRPGSSVVGRVDAAGDKDWFGVELEAGLLYRFKLQRYGAGDAPLNDPYLHGLHDSSGTLIAGTADNDSGTGRNSLVSFIADTAGTYFVSAGGKGNSTGEYRLTVESVPGATEATLSSLALDAVTLSPAFSPDVFAYEASIANTVNSVTVTAATTDTDATAAIRPAERPADISSTGHQIAVIEGTTVIKVTVTAANGVTKLRYTVTALVPEIPADDTTPATVAVDSSAGGLIHAPGDRDWFAVELEADVGYQIDLVGDPDIEPLKDPYLRGIHDSAGTLIADTSDDNSGFRYDSRVEFVPHATSTYYISAGSTGMGSRRTGRYVLSVTKLGIVDASLSALTLTGLDLVPTFASGTFNYALTVTSSVDSVSVDAVAADSAATVGITPAEDAADVASAGHQVALKAGSNTIRVRVTAIHGLDTATYTIKVYREDADDVAGLRSLTLDGVELGPDFRNSWLSYSATVPTSATHVTLSADPSSSDASVQVAPADADDTTLGVQVPLVDAGVDGAPPTTEILVTVTSADSTDTRTYSITVYGIDIDPSAPHLKWFGLDGLDTSPRFSPGIYDYTVEVPAHVSYVSAFAQGGNAGGSVSLGPLNGYSVYANSYDQDDRMPGYQMNLVEGEPGGEPVETFVWATTRNANWVYQQYMIVVERAAPLEVDYVLPANCRYALEVLVGGEAEGFVSAEDRSDCFTAELTAGKLYHLDVKGPTLASRYLYGVFAADGTRAPAGAGRGQLQDRKWFRPAETAMYVIEAGARTDTGQLRLIVTEQDDDFTQSVDTSGEVATDGTAVSGEIEYPEDVDWFAFEAVAGEVYQIGLEGVDGGGGTLPDPKLVGIYDAQGRRLMHLSADGGGTGRDSALTFFAPAAGTTYIAVGKSGGSDSGTYSLSVLSALGVTADASTTGAVEVDGSVIGVIDVPGVVDWHAVELQQGSTYQVTLAGRDSPLGLLRDPLIVGVYDANSALIAGTSDDDSGPGRDSRLFFTPQLTGTFYVAVGGKDYHEGAYLLSVSRFYGTPPSRPDPSPADDFAASTATKGLVNVGESIDGRFDWSGDEDWIAVPLEKGRRYGVYVGKRGSGALHIRGLALHSPWGMPAGGVRLHTTAYLLQQDSPRSEATVTAAETGLHYLVLRHDASSPGGEDYSVYVFNIDDDHPADMSTTAATSLGETFVGNMSHVGDRDWIAVELEANQNHVVMWRPEPFGYGDGREPAVNTIPMLAYVYDENGEPVRHFPWPDDEFGPRPTRATFRTDAAGTYYISMAEYDFIGGPWFWGFRPVGRYAVDVWKYNPELAASRSTSGEVAAGGSEISAINTPGDIDWFQVQFTQGQTYRIEMAGRQTWAGSLLDPRIAGVYAAGGRLLESHTDGDWGYNSVMVHTATRNGDHFIAAAAGGDEFGSYRLSVTDATGAPADDFEATTSTVGSVTLDGPAMGSIETSGDVDWFAVELVEGSRYKIQLLKSVNSWPMTGRNTGGGTLVDAAVVAVADGSGTAISGVGGSRTVPFVARSSGTYYIAAGTSTGSTATGTYTLQVTELATGLVEFDLSDDFAEGTSTAGAVSVGGTVTAMVNTPHEQDWFAAELVAGTAYVIDVTGAPSGAGTLEDPYLGGIFGADGGYIAATTNHDRDSTSVESRIEFTPDDSGTHYIAVGADDNGVGTYTLAVTESS